MCEKVLTKSYCVQYMFSLFSMQAFFFVENASAKALRISSTIFLPMVTLRRPFKKYELIESLISLNCEKVP